MFFSDLGRRPAQDLINITSSLVTGRFTNRRAPIHLLARVGEDALILSGITGESRAFSFFAAMLLIPVDAAR